MPRKVTVRPRHEASSNAQINDYACLIRIVDCLAEKHALHLCQPSVDALCQQCRNTYGRHLEACDGFVFNHRDTCVPDLLKGSKDLKAPVNMVGFQARTGVMTRGLMIFYQTYRKALHLNVNMRLAVLSLLPDRADRTDAKCTTRTGFGAFTAAWGR